MTDFPIHVAKRGKGVYLFLKKSAPDTYQWFEGEKELAIRGNSVEEACRALAGAMRGEDGFTFLACGSRFTLPERDEHGMNALFSQMAASFGASSGVYFDSELGHSCIVKNASQEAYDLYRKLCKMN